MAAPDDRSIDAGAYGDAFADVYDAWYGDVTDTDQCVATLADLAGRGPVLELGVGTGRLALPLAATGLTVHGIDASAQMLAGLRSKPGGRSIPVALADMSRYRTSTKYSLVFVAYNTLFNLTTEREQARCIGNVASMLGRGGTFVVEAFVPSANPVDIEHRTVTRGDRTDPNTADPLPGHAVTTTRDPFAQTVNGEHRSSDAAGRMISRHWMIRYLFPSQLDSLCAAVGLTLAERWNDWRRHPAAEDDPVHISLYRRRGDPQNEPDIV